MSLLLTSDTDSAVHFSLPVHPSKHPQQHPSSADRQTRETAQVCSLSLAAAALNCFLFENSLFSHTVLGPVINFQTTLVHICMYICLKIYRFKNTCNDDSDI